MNYVCAYCLKEYKEKDETGNPGDTSHGACRECYEMAMKTIDEKGMVRGGIWMDVSMVVKLVMIPSHIFWSGYEEGGRS